MDEHPASCALHFYETSHINGLMHTRMEGTHVIRHSHSLDAVYVDPA